MPRNPASHEIIRCGIEVHSALGAGMLESTISACMFDEMTNAGLHIEHQVRLPIVYKGLKFLTHTPSTSSLKNVLVEIKCVENLE
jgi:GxxExxY protein